MQFWQSPSQYAVFEATEGEFISKGEVVETNDDWANLRDVI